MPSHSYEFCRGTIVRGFAIIAGLARFFSKLCICLTPEIQLGCAKCYRRCMSIGGNWHSAYFCEFSFETLHISVEHVSSFTFPFRYGFFPPAPHNLNSLAQIGGFRS